MFQISRFAPFASKIVLAHLKPKAILSHDRRDVKLGFCVVDRRTSILDRGALAAQNAFFPYARGKA